MTSMVKPAPRTVELLALDSGIYGRRSGAMHVEQETRLHGSSSLMPWVLAVVFPLGFCTAASLGGAGVPDAGSSGFTRGASASSVYAPLRRRRDDTPVNEVSVPSSGIGPEVSDLNGHGLAQRAASAQDAITAKEQVAAIQAALSLTVTEVADILGVARGTVHGWMKDSVAVPRTQMNAQRLRDLHRVAQGWRERTTETLGRLVAARVGDSDTSLLNLLTAQTWDSAAIDRLMNTLATHLKEQVAAKREKRERGSGSPRVITEENIELERLRLRGLG